ncbi:hydrogenase maturation protease [Methylocaldum sp.]|uniref:hydrogenase maturation protease n=1 Tax=Methylocaldum sp. TaxID=1969727 RepID=UPI002D31FD6A|nr:hydrogenase maturation protease [Methylocaldum sp.]HYE37732.1 hydrogenase maturation protease [Methylocaldum sp.]
MSARHIVCFGNELHGDDGFGIRVYEQLRRLTWPNDVKLFNAGIAGLNALEFLVDCRQAILVDALADTGNAGAVCVFKPDDSAGRWETPVGHGLGIPYLLKALEVVRESPPDIVIVGAEVEKEAIKPFSPGLSDKSERAVEKAIRAIQSLLPV